MTIVRRLSTLAFAATMFVLSAKVSAQAVPHFAAGSAQFVSQTDFVGTGRATHLGRYTEIGSVTFSPTRDPAVLAISGANVYTAANGDELYGLLSGELDTSTGAITATVTYVGGTGRFAAASGSSRLTGQMLGGGAVSIAVAGSISY